MHQKQYASVVPQEINGPGFAFQLPQYDAANDFTINDKIEFAAKPFDPRYYEPSPQQQEQQEIYEEIDPQQQQQQQPQNAEDDDLILETESGVKSASIETPVRNNKILIPSPMHVAPLSTGGDSQSQRILHRAQQKLQQQQQLQFLNNKQASDVLQKPLQVEFDNTTSLYIVALIAGLSCAFSTGVSFFCYNHHNIFTSFFNFFQFFFFCSLLHSLSCIIR